jgi:hypothetical protein
MKIPLKKRPHHLLRQTSFFARHRNKIVTVTPRTCFLLQLKKIASDANDLSIVTVVTISPTTERALALLRGFIVTVTFPRGTPVTAPHVATRGNVVSVA